ncbi:hypothetical protein [Phenylobacterium sp.]|uniref:hypothetical protein n=1 Tax=Phenylobacterium sp. TaxID=1871053 RepID=UPI003BAD021D
MKGRPPTPKSPQEKKQISYASDRRNSYGENDKASRKLIPLRKAQAARSVRRKVNQAVAAIPELDEASAAVVESSARHDVDRVGGWTKSPDKALGEYLDQQKGRREFRSGRKSDQTPDKA